jgi:hypothetical protein
MFLFMGIAASALIWIVTRRRSWTARIIGSVFCGLTAVVAFCFLRGFGAISVSNVRDASGGALWKDVILFGLLVAGMLARGTFDALNEYIHASDNTPSPAWKKRLARIALPLLPAVMLFQPVLSQAQGSEISWQLAVFSFQNGFFWDALFDTIRQKTGGSAK